MKNWIYVGDALADAPAWVREHSIIFRPAILRHPVTRKLVLWLNRLPRLGKKNVVESYKKSGFIVGVENAGNPEKPFKFVSSEAEGMIKMAHKGGADFSLLQDDDGNAYIAYGAWHNFKITEGWKASNMTELELNNVKQKDMKAMLQVQLKILICYRF